MCTLPLSNSTRSRASSSIRISYCTRVRASKCSKVELRCRFEGAVKHTRTHIRAPIHIRNTDKLCWLDIDATVCHLVLCWCGTCYFMCCFKLRAVGVASVLLTSRNMLSSRNSVHVWGAFFGGASTSKRIGNCSHNGMFIRELILQSRQSISNHRKTARRWL